MRTDGVTMRTLMLSLIAGVTVAIAAPAMAQVHVHAETPAVRVQVGPGHHSRAHVRRCRTVVTRIKRANGTVITKRERRCRR